VANHLQQKERFPLLKSIVIKIRNTNIFKTANQLKTKNKIFTKVANIENETKQKSTKMADNICNENNQILDNTVSEFSSTSFNNESHNPVSQMAMFSQQIYSMGPPMIPHPLLMSSAICISTNSSPHSINISDQDVETRRR
jgi:hypothetical protein